jgi:hypothetical protein
MNIKPHFELTACDKPHETDMDIIGKTFLRREKKTCSKFSNVIAFAEKYVSRNFGIQRNVRKYK